MFLKIVEGDFKGVFHGDTAIDINADSVVVNDSVTVENSL